MASTSLSALVPSPRCSDPTRLAVAMGMASKSVETASNLPMLLLLLPFLGSGFGPTDTMPSGLRWFADYQPFTPFVETLRGLLDGEPLGANLPLALAWCVVISAAGYTWSMATYEKKSVR
ncbi:ABC transporter permease [Rhodococcus sp. IEGM 1381]|nr:ABC transporter permease [Rhodococcus sp. IEGM 1381]MDI9894315.1 ABC transporter permease [Rhodococcus sp. IEGM 1381]